MKPVNKGFDLEESKEKKKRSDEMNRKVIADISHDLKTPITVIKGYTSAILDKRIDEKKQKEYLIKIQNKADEMTALVNALNEYAKLNHPDFKLNLEHKDITKSARAYFDDKENELEIFKYRTNINIPSHEIFCNYDEFQMKRVIDNIISNTIKHTVEMTCVKFEITDNEEHVIMRIGDDGPGISQQLKDKIFTPFMVEDELRSEKSGLGMAIVKMIIDLHNGSINVAENKKGEFIYEIKIPKST